MKPRIAVIGKGHVGSALAAGLGRVAYEVRTVGNDPKGVRDAANWADVIVLAVPYPAFDHVVASLGSAADGKTVIDVSNPLTPDYQPAIGFTTSAAEELQAKLPAARVVKAFNHMFAAHMGGAPLKNTTLTLFVAGDDAAARDAVSTIGRDLGFDTVDAGPLTSARWLEALGYLNIYLGFMAKMGTDIGFRLVR